MSNYTLTVQDVLGDPFVSGGNINIINNSFTTLIFHDKDNQIADPIAEEFVSLDGGVTWLSYDFLGSGAVRGNSLKMGAFIRIDNGDGTFQTVAIDLNADGDSVPNLQNGNTGLTVTTLDPTTPVTWPVPACFVAGTLITVPGGQRSVEDIAVGDLVETLDRGAQAVRWVGRRKVPGAGRFAPIRFEAGVLGNARPLLVSPEHRMLWSGWQTELHFGEGEVLVAAKHFLGMAGVTRCPTVWVDYVHLLFDRHEVILSEGVPSESFHPASQLLDRDQAMREEIEAIFPEVEDLRQEPRSAARPVLSAREARLIAA
ncbi:MAG: hypothetical protein B7Z02_07270 [Rhodobacterales bacterium 32-67-9]|nr:MAG: hypothetical protein B7Z02_07270 [Rhodobacterales bacterium 32-67-9]